MRLMKILATKNYCYTDLPDMKNIKGILVHSTGCNNPNLRRYVAPDNGLIGTPSSSHWNQRSINGVVQKLGVHAFIGKLKDGTVATVQVQEWKHKCYHCGTHPKTRKSGNSNYISFEICEDNLKDSAYFKAVYQEAVELCAYLCEMYHLDPLKCITCHCEAHANGFASNHADVMHWFKRYGKTMDTFRNGVLNEMEDNDMTAEKFTEMYNQMMAKREALAMNPDSKIYPEFKKAIDMGITDGSAPYGMITRAQAAVMTVRAVEAALAAKK